MRQITADTLAYDLSLAIQYGDLPEAIATHLRGDLARWEAQQVDPARGGAFIRQWWTDHAYAVQAIAMMDVAERTQLARDYIAYLRTYGATDLNPEQLVAKWQNEVARMRAGGSVWSGHSDPPTSAGPMGDYTTELSRLQVRNI